VTYGLVVASAAEDLTAKVDRMLRWAGDQVGIDFERRDASSYEELANGFRAGDIDVAWLPPIVYVRLAPEAEAIGSILRGGKSAYEAALIVRKDTRIKSIEALRGTRAGWVDRWSAAGFVLPRVKLSLLGVDPRTLFRTETFHGSHRAAIGALLDGACDVVGTYAQADKKGNVVGGAWSEVLGADVRVLATFGAIPPDVIAGRRGLPTAVREKVLGTLRAAVADDRGRKMLKDVFGGDALSEGLAKGYDSLASALKMATARGLFD
jgi:phosphate/phosphite/phosphonate ABC transporter binding protein